jgi:type III secretion system FlhB-like substrate exporter
VVAKGYGQLAERIIDRAKDAGVFVHDSPELVSLLMQVDLDRHIPEELYRAVAEILAFVYFWKTRRPVPISSLNPGWPDGVTACHLPDFCQAAFRRACLACRF